MVSKKKQTVKQVSVNSTGCKALNEATGNVDVTSFKKLVEMIQKWRQARNIWTTSSNSTARIGAGFVDYVKTCLRFNITGFFDSPFPNFFTELYLATCPHNKVVLGTRDSLSWATSRIKHHGNSKTGLVCPHAASPALRDPFSYTQCAHFDTIRRAQTLAAGEDGHGRGAAAYAPRPNTSLNFNGISAPALAKVFEKYDAFVARMVPQNRLLRINLFTSEQLRPNASDKQQDTNRIAWTDVNSAVVEKFVRPGIGWEAKLP